MTLHRNKRRVRMLSMSYDGLCFILISIRIIDAFSGSDLLVYLTIFFANLGHSVVVHSLMGRACADGTGFETNHRDNLADRVCDSGNVSLFIEPLSRQPGSLRVFYCVFGALQ